MPCRWRTVRWHAAACPARDRRYNTSVARKAVVCPMPYTRCYGGDDINILPAGLEISPPLPLLNGTCADDKDTVKNAMNAVAVQDNSRRGKTKFESKRFRRRAGDDAAAVPGGIGNIAAVAVGAVVPSQVTIACVTTGQCSSTYASRRVDIRRRSSRRYSILPRWPCTICQALKGREFRHRVRRRAGE